MSREFINFINNYVSVYDNNYIKGIQISNFNIQPYKFLSSSEIVNPNNILNYKKVNYSIENTALYNIKDINFNQNINKNIDKNIIFEISQNEINRRVLDAYIKLIDYIFLNNPDLYNYYNCYIEFKYPNTALNNLLKDLINNKFMEYKNKKFINNLGYSLFFLENIKRILRTSGSGINIHNELDKYLNENSIENIIKKQYNNFNSNEYYKTMMDYYKSQFININDKKRLDEEYNVCLKSGDNPKVIILYFIKKMFKQILLDKYPNIDCKNYLRIETNTADKIIKELEQNNIEKYINIQKNMYKIDNNCTDIITKIESILNKNDYLNFLWKQLNLSATSNKPPNNNTHNELLSYFEKSFKNQILEKYNKNIIDIIKQKINNDKSYADLFYILIRQAAQLPLFIDDENNKNIYNELLTYTSNNKLDDSIITNEKEFVNLFCKDTYLINWDLEILNKIQIICNNVTHILKEDQDIKYDISLLDDSSIKIIKLISKYFFGILINEGLNCNNNNILNEIANIFNFKATNEMKRKRVDISYKNKVNEFTQKLFKGPFMILNKLISKYNSNTDEKFINLNVLKNILLEEQTNLDDTECSIDCILIAFRNIIIKLKIIYDNLDIQFFELTNDILKICINIMLFNSIKNIDKLKMIEEDKINDENEKENDDMIESDIEEIDYDDEESDTAVDDDGLSNNSYNDKFKNLLQDVNIDYEDDLDVDYCINIIRNYKLPNYIKNKRIFYFAF